MELPDLSADPIASDWEDGAELPLVLREVKTWNLVALLEPETKAVLGPEVLSKSRLPIRRISFSLREKINLPLKRESLGHP